MKKRTILCIVAFVGLIVVPAIVIDAQADPKVKDVNVVNTPLPVTSEEYRFVGLSESATTGWAGGLANMNALCQATYTSTARMCTTEEYMLSPVAVAPEVEAWVAPKIVAIVGPSPDWDYVAYDYSGLSIGFGNIPAGLSKKLSCRMWLPASSNSWGMAVGRIMALRTCETEMPVTCCDKQ